MEEEDEQEDQDQDQEEPEVEGEVDQHLGSPSDLGGVPWKEAVELHAKLRGDQSEDGEGEAAVDTVSRDGELDEEAEEEEEDEDEEEDEEESSDGKFVLQSLCDIKIVPVKAGDVVLFVSSVC